MLQVYDRVLPSRSTQTLVALLVIVAFLFAIQAALEAIRTRMLTRVGRRLDEDLSGPAFRSAMSVATVAANGERVDPIRDLDQIRQFVATPGPAALFDLPWTPLYLVVCFLFHPWLGWLTMSGALVVSVLALWGELRSRASSARIAQIGALRQRAVDGARRNAEVLATMNLAVRFEQRFEASTAEFLANLQKGSDRRHRRQRRRACAALAAAIAGAGAGRLSRDPPGDFRRCDHRDLDPVVARACADRRRGLAMAAVRRRAPGRRRA